MRRSLLLALLLLFPALAEAQTPGVRNYIVASSATVTGGVNLNSPDFDNRTFHGRFHVVTLRVRSQVAVTVCSFSISAVDTVGGGPAQIANATCPTSGQDLGTSVLSVVADPQFIRVSVAITGTSAVFDVLLSSFNNAAYKVGESSLYAFNPTGGNEERLQSGPASFSNINTGAGLDTRAFNYVYDGNNWDALESLFLIQQQGSPVDSNDGSGIPTVALMGFDRGLGTGNLLASTSAAGLGVSDQIRVNSATHFLSFQAEETQTTAIDVLNVTAQITNDLYFEGVNVSCLAACVVNIQIVTAVGTTCTTVAPANLNPAGGASNAVSNTNCTTDPTVVANSTIRVDLPATSSRWVDLTGINATVTGDGVSCVSATATTVSCTIRWFEK